MDQVRIWEETLTLPTYFVGPQDPNPPFQRGGSWSIYPYPLLDDLRPERGERDYLGVFLENEYLRVIVLPELGGHLYSAFDKVSETEVFYRNHVVKPGLVALRGAWISGGIEFNFPCGHSVTTVSLVDHLLQENEDGSATCWIANLEHISRMKWAIGIRLAPGCSWLETDVRLFNRTADRERFYVWENAAVYATDDLHLLYPIRKARVSGGMVDFPVTADGWELSWYRNHDHADDIFALGVKEDFFGCYYPERDVGVVHWADFRDAVGKKFFTWGTAESGLIWADILSDDDGPYCEIQSGRFVDQGVFEFLEPHGLEAWREYWWPLHGLGHFTWANLDAAVNLEVRDGVAEVAVGVSQLFPDAVVALENEGEVLWEEAVDLAPERPLRRQVALREGVGPLTLRVWDEEEEEIIAYTDQQEPWVDAAAIETALHPPPPPAEKSAQWLCTEAARQERYRAFGPARKLYEQALAQQPDLALALCGLGSLDLRAGLYEAAAERLQRAVTLDPDLARASYLLGLARRALGQWEEAGDALWRVTRGREFQAPALCALGEMELAIGEEAIAVERLQRALEAQPTDVKAAGLLAAALRHLEEWEKAAFWRERAWAVDPTDALATAEEFFATETGQARAALRARLKGAPQLYLELATDYGNAGLLEEALRVLEMGLEDAPGPGETVVQEDPPETPHPLLKYYQGYYLEQLGEAEAARAAFAEAARMSPHLVFPHRLETFPVLRRALELQPDDARAHLYLGHLLYAKGREEEAVREWEEAARLEPGLAVAHRNLGLHAQQAGDLESAAAHYERARAANPFDYRYHRDLDDLYRSLKRDFAERLGCLEAAPPEVRERQDVVWREALLDTLLGRFDEAIERLTTTVFRPWEGAVAMRRIYVDAYLGRGRAALARGDYEAARADFAASLEYPVHIGVGRPKSPHDAQSYVLLAEALTGLGRSAEAREALEQAVAESHRVASEGRYWQLLALRQLGREDEAETGGRAMLAEARKRAEAEPNQAEAQFVLGLALRFTGDETAAQEALTRAVELDPQHVEARWQAGVTG